MTHQPFVWKKENEIGIPELDEQHEHFFAIANEIFALAEKTDPTREEVLQKMVNLADYAFYHFDTEEGMLKGLP